jgi:hypothetical protein
LWGGGGGGGQNLLRFNVFPPPTLTLPHKEGGD